MKRLDIIIRPEKLELLKTILNKANVGGITMVSAMGCGTQKGQTDISSFKGLQVSSLNLIPKVMATVVVSDEIVDELLAIIHTELSTGKVGDGKVFISTIDDAMRIRTGERGKKSL